MPTWTLEVNKGAGFVQEVLLNHDFRKPLNSIEELHCLIAQGTTLPAEDNEVRLTWDLGGAQQRVWFRGIITHRLHDELGGMLQLWCMSDALTVAKSMLGDERFYNATPYAIVQGAVAPLGLLYNAQSNLSMAYGTVAPNAITALNPGNALTFRGAASCLDSIGRLCEEGTSGGGPTYGLEWFVDRDGADAKRFNLVTRRQRAAVYTPDSFQIGDTLHVVGSSREADRKYDRVRVTGSGSGTSRIVSAWVGAGAREYVFEDKTVHTVAAANNLANRLYNELNTLGTTRYETETYTHNIATDVGDDVSIVPDGGGAPTTYRCVEIRYDFNKGAFTFMLGRRRDFFLASLGDLRRNAQGMGQSSQITDVRPESIQGSPPTYSTQYHMTIKSAPQVVAAGAVGATILDSGLDTVFAGSNAADLGLAEGLLVSVVLDIDAAQISDGGAGHTHDLQNHTHTMGNHTHEYDKADTPTGNANHVAGVDAANHALTYTATATGAPSTNTTSGPTPNATGSSAAGAANLAGPFYVQVLLYFSGDPYNPANTDFVVIMQRILPYLRAGNLNVDLSSYLFAAESPTTPGNFTPTRILLTVNNYGAFPATFGGTTARGTSCELGLWRNGLHRHNEV